MSAPEFYTASIACLSCMVIVVVLMAVGAW
jgi:hypothetical protein